MVLTKRASDNEGEIEAYRQEQVAKKRAAKAEAEAEAEAPRGQKEDGAAEPF